MRNNLRSWFMAVTNKEAEQGLAWYGEAQDFVKQTADLFGHSTYLVACVLSMLSPNNKWERNKFDCLQVLTAFRDGVPPKDVKVCTYSANKLKAFKALATGETDFTASSPKTHSFAMNCGLLSSDHITIDKWHIRACLTKPTEGVVDCVESITPKQYRRVEALTATLCKEINDDLRFTKLHGFQFQAMLWICIKNVWDR